MRQKSFYAQSERPDWDSRSFLSGIDVTALHSPDSPCSVVNHTKLGFKGAQKFEDLTKSKNFYGTLLHKISFIVLTKKKKMGVRCTLIFSIWATQNRTKQRRRKKDTLVCLINGYHNTSRVDLKEGKGRGEPLSSILDDVK